MIATKQKVMSREAKESLLREKLSLMDLRYHLMCQGSMLTCVRLTDRIEEIEAELNIVMSQPAQDSTTKSQDCSGLAR